jgi:hypothetical protein
VVAVHSEVVFQSFIDPLPCHSAEPWSQPREASTCAFPLAHPFPTSGKDFEREEEMVQIEVQWPVVADKPLDSLLVWVKMQWNVRANVTLSSIIL